MNYKLRLALTCILAVGANNAFGASLLEVYQRAQQSDPTLREADANRLATREARPQAWASLLPQIDGQVGVSRTFANSKGSSPRQIDLGPGGLITTTGETDSRRDPFGWSISLRSTVFSWAKWAALDRSKSQVAQAEVNYQVAQQDLVLRVAQRYFNVLAAKDTLDANNAAAEAFSRQLEQFEKRFEVGLIAITDVQEARAERDRTSADVISAKRNLATTIELLRELTGDDVSELQAPGDDLPLKTPDPASEDSWVKGSLERNLTLISTRLSADIADANVSVARAGHAPTLDLSATHSDNDTDSYSRVTTDNPDVFLRGNSNSLAVQDSVSLTLNVPIFSSGATQSLVRQSVYQRRAAVERVERSTRETERAARDNYLGVISNISRVQALKQAFESSRTAIQATEAGFEVGTRTTVDVLQSRRTLYTAETAYKRSRYDYILSVIQLELAAGTLTDQDVSEISSWMK